MVILLCYTSPFSEVNTVLMQI